MTVHTFDEADNLKTGDILYRYELTTIFPAYVERPEQSIPGLTSVVVDAEDIQVIAVAQITGGAFQSFWIPAPYKVEAIAEQGSLIRSETVARRLFPDLAEYQYKGKP